MTKIMIVVGHPHADSYCDALGQAYLRGAESGRHRAKLFMLARMELDAILRMGYRGRILHRQKDPKGAPITLRAQYLTGE
jgi:putative NADPH-quinone reductase